MAISRRPPRRINDLRRRRCQPFAVKPYCASAACCGRPAISMARYHAYTELETLGTLFVADQPAALAARPGTLPFV